MTNRKEQLTNFFQQLSEEAGQDQASFEGSTFEKASISISVLRDREREYKDVEKHYVRRYGWLPAAKQIREHNKRALRYLTLPAYYRLDVELFLKEGLLEIESRNGRKVASVAAFETEPERYGRMEGLEPGFQLFGFGKIEDALTDVKHAYYKDLVDAFPFDLVNLDLTSSLTPKHQGPYSRVMQAVDNVFQRQAAHDGIWGLFLTFRNVPAEWEPKAHEAFKANLQSNIDDYVKVKEAFFEIYRDSNVKSLETIAPLTVTSQAVLKWLVDRAHQNRTRIERHWSYEYKRRNPPLESYTITKHVLLLRQGSILETDIPFKSVPRQSWMEDDLVTCIRNHRPVDVEEKLCRLLETKVRVYDDIAAEIEELCETKVHDEAE